jgi:hypothetical protein
LYAKQILYKKNQENKNFQHHGHQNSERKAKEKKSPSNDG